MINKRKQHGLKSSRGPRRNGFVLLAVAGCLLCLIGFVGLCVDLGRLYISKNELQAYSDAAALAANQELDGTDEGIVRARSIASNYPNRWNFDTADVVSTEVTFATSPTGVYTPTPPSPPKNFKYTRVQANGALPMYFMSVFYGARGQSFPAAFLLTFRVSNASVGADSQAGQVKATRFKDNLLPYSPDAHLDPGRPPVFNPGSSVPDPFNYVKGKQYTLRWPPPGQRDKPANWCPGDRDAAFVSPDPSSERGFIDIGKIPGSGGSSYIRRAIISNVQTHPLQLGEAVEHVSGNRGVESEALRERVAQDTDDYSATWAAYSANRAGDKRVGNGRRLVFVPVNNPYDGDRIVDFAAFFLPVQSEICGDSMVAPCCAEYVGAGLFFGRQPATEEVGVYFTRLLR